MSTDVFPVFKGLTFSVVKTPTWGTRMQRAVSGRELRVSDYANPIWNFTLTYSVLHDATFGTTYVSPYTELRTLMNFVNVHRGAWDTFLFDDITDDTVVGGAIATADGVNSGYGLVRALIPGGFKEQMFAPHTVSAVYLDGVPTSAYTLDSNTGVITFTSPPSAGVAITADFTYYFRVRFAADRLDFEEFYHNFWEVKQLKLVSVVL
ncbi:MAG TPA: DUF2460 domain-containing protein [Actinomycetota bacterium]|nr:DUF2460 domain-containing protein [Actinomycetota bacterium]